MSSVWIDGAERPRFDRLSGSKRTDVLIVGGGLAGILCAYMLRRSGVDCILIEADRICNGVTRNTTAKITLQHGLIYDKLISRFGEEGARLYLWAQKSACSEFARLCKDIKCDYETKDSYVYSVSNRYKIEREVAALNLLGETAELAYDLPLPFDAVGAVKVKNQAQFNPLKFAFEIARDLPIYERTKAREIMPNRVMTDLGEITCDKMIIATHFPILNKHGGYFLKLYQHRSYVLALENAADVAGMYVDEDDRGLSFRNYKNLLLLGGGSHRTGKKGGSYTEIERIASSAYPSAKIVRKWATQDCMTLDEVPYIGRYSKGTPDIFVATGFNKWGMSSSMLSAMILSEMVQEKHSEYERVFSPTRSMLHPQLAVNAFESVVGLLTPTAPRCPHLGCALKYNKQEHSWDCPCHGSRFSESGELINNPATDDKNF